MDRGESLNSFDPCRSEFGFAVLLGENVQNMRLEPGIQPATRALVADHIMINLGKFIKNTFFKNPGYAPGSAQRSGQGS